MQSLLQRLARIAPFFAASRWGFVLAIVGSIVGAATEPVIPQLLKELLDKGFQSKLLPLWAVPVAIIGLFAIRGVAGFVAQYGLGCSANRVVETKRGAIFERLVSANPAIFSRHSASSLPTQLVYKS